MCLHYWVAERVHQKYVTEWQEMKVYTLDAECRGESGRWAPHLALCGYSYAIACMI